MSATVEELEDRLTLAIARVFDLEVVLALACNKLDELFEGLGYDLQHPIDVETCVESLPGDLADFWRQWRSNPDRLERLAAGQDLQTFWKSDFNVPLLDADDFSETQQTE